VNSVWTELRQMRHFGVKSSMRPFVITAIVVGAVALFVGMSAWAILQNADALVADIESTLNYQEPNTDGALSGSFMLVDHGPVPDGIVALRIAIWTILFWGIPMAMLGGWLARRTRLRGTCWSSTWSVVFLGGFIFQLSALLAAPFMFIAFAAYVGDVRVMFMEPDAMALSTVLLLIAVCSAAALRSWLHLRAAAHDDAFQIAHVVNSMD
jgi:hypothetical protein